MPKLAEVQADGGPERAPKPPLAKMLAGGSSERAREQAGAIALSR